MDIEKLKELTQSEDSDLWDYKEELIALINEAIARQSVKDEDVAEAISHIQGGYGDVWQWPKNRRDTIITALQAYQPWIPISERLPEPIISTTGFDVRNTYLVARFEGCNPSAYFYGYSLAHYWESGWGGVDGSCSLSVTHWMPLPEPPKGE